MNHRVLSPLAQDIHHQLGGTPQDIREVAVSARFAQQMTFPSQYEYRKGQQMFLDPLLQYAPFCLQVSAGMEHLGDTEWRARFRQHAVLTLDHLVRTQMQREMDWVVSRVTRSECGDQKTSHRRYRYDHRHAPPLLVLHVQRLDGRRYRAQRHPGLDNTVRVSPSATLRLPRHDVPFLAGDTSTYTTYYLKGLGIRSGSDRHTGHWVAMVHTHQDHWTRFDDQDATVQTRVALEDTVQGTFFLYDRVPPDQPHAACTRHGQAYANPNSMCYINTLLQLFAHSTAVARLLGVHTNVALTTSQLQPLFPPQPAPPGQP